MSKPSSSTSSLKPKKSITSSFTTTTNPIKKSTLSDFHLDPTLPTEAALRLLQAKFQILQNELSDSLHANTLKDASLQTLQSKLSQLSESQKSLMTHVSTLEKHVEKLKKQVSIAEDSKKQVESEKKELEKQFGALEKKWKVVEGESGSKDSKLQNALQDIIILKAQVQKVETESALKIEKYKRTNEKLLADFKRSERQKGELVGIFKKQNMLIDVLKREKIHLEAVQRLGFSEEEFMRALGSSGRET
ncbi:Golgin sub A member 2 [Chytridiales sp. JEL 0842]|nr:Golgin sub A member 2 [Chytridiales sp. JEL 0842]